MSTESNRHQAISMADRAMYDKMKSDESFQVDWRSYIQVTSDDLDVDETGRPIWDELVRFMH